MSSLDRIAQDHVEGRKPLLPSLHALTEYRTALHLSRPELARRLGVRRWTIFRIETGRATPRRRRVIERINGILK
jgi:predicted transcriptional regulator